MKGSKNAQTLHTQAQNIGRAATKSLAAAQRELAAANKAVQASQKGIVTANNKVVQATKAHEDASRRLRTVYNAQQRLSKGSVQSLAREAEAVRKLADAKGNVKIRRIDEKRARKAVDTYEGPAAGRKFLEDDLVKAQQRLLQSERALDKARKGSVQSVAAQRNAAEQLRIKTEHLQAAQRDLATKEAALRAAHNSVTEAALAQSSANHRLAAAAAEVAAAQAKATAASTALSSAQRASVATSAMAGDALGRNVVRGTKVAEKGIMDLASRSQWLGRQLQTNFTLPIMIAGGFAVKFALDNERAFTRLAKVYGDFNLPEEIQVRELEALRGAFRALSEEYGVNQKEVIEIGAAWAAAGSSGVALARSVENTMKTMVLGEIEAAEATEALIAIQAQYELSTAQLTDTINKMNMVENQTGASMKDLIVGMQRASGAAASAGVSIEELLAGMAALVPAAGSAANAGNALKTIYTRVVAPTRDAIQILEQAGIKVDQMGWKTLGASDRLKVLAEEFDGMSDTQQRFAARTIAGIYQIGRFDILLRAMKNPLSFYHRGLEAASDSTAALKQAQIELDTVLSSDPQRVKRLGVIYQNAAADLGQQLIPAVIMAGTVIADLAQGFNDLNPYIQKTIVTTLLFMAVVGPLVRWAAGIVVLFGAVGRGIAMVGGAFASAGGMITRLFILPFQGVSLLLTGFVAGVGKAIAAVMALRSAGGIFAGFVAIVRGNLARIGMVLLGWPALLIGALAAGIAIFHEQISQAFSVVWNTIKGNLAAFGPAFSPLVSFFHKVADGIVAAFYKLPQGIQSAMMAVINIVRQAVMAVYELLSYLNPFARHSPSLVENVTEGMGIVRDEFAKITSISDPIEKAYRDIERFKRVTADLKNSLDTFKRAEDLKELLSFAPGAGGSFLALVRDLQSMQPVMDSLEQRMKGQQKVVDQWGNRVDSLNRKLDDERDKLDNLRDAADKWSDKLQEANDRLSDFASRPLQGLGAMEDKIFANTQAQKVLQLQMMEMEDAVGPIDDVKDRLARLSGEIEVLRGEQTSLREAGAGGDILAAYDREIAALESQQGAINETANDYNDLKDQLEALQRAGQKLDLQKSINFDGLQRDIQKAADAITEMPFDKIMEGIKGAQEDIKKYGDRVDEANKRVKEQQEVVDTLEEKLEKVQERYDLERDKLEAITDRYNKWKDAINDVKSALDDVGQAASEAAQKGMKKRGGGGGGGGVNPAVQDFLDAAGGDFTDVLGSGGAIGREGGLGDQSSLIDEFTKGLEKKQKDLAAKLDIFKPIKEKWAEFKGWWGSAVVPAVSGLMDDLGAGFGDIDWSGPLKDVDKSDSALKDTFDGIANAFKAMGKGLSLTWDLIGPDIKEFYKILGEKLGKAFRELKGPVGDLVEAFGRFWNAMKPIVVIFGGALLVALKIVIGMIVGQLGPALDGLINIVSGVIEVFAGLLNFIAFIFTGDFAAAWDAIVQIFKGFVDILVGLWQGTVGAIIGSVKGFVMAVVGFFQWLYDTLVGHSIIPDMINAIVNWFTGLPGKIIGALISLGQKLWDLIKAAWQKLQDALSSAWTNTWNWLKGIPQKVYDALVALIGLYRDAGSAIFNAVWDGIKSVWTSVKNWVTEKVQWIVDKLTGIRDSLAGKFTGMFDGIKDAFRSAINWIISGWNGLSWGLPAFDPPGPGSFPGFMVNTPDIPLLAAGGTAMKNMPYIVGEVGPEFFLPGVTGRVTSNNDIATLMTMATKDALSSLTGPGVASTFSGTSPAKLGMIASQANRRIDGATATGTPVGGSTVINNRNEYHFHGDLTFPNIKTGEDAETFLTNLSDLAG